MEKYNKIKSKVSIILYINTLRFKMTYVKFYCDTVINRSINNKIFICSKSL